MNPATKAPNSIASGALNGFAGLISPTTSGTRARPSRAKVDTKQSAPLKEPLALAQHSQREFLTEAPAFVSVKGCGVPPHSVCAQRKLSRVRESIGQRDHYTDN
jgi:hypothetical protein